MIRSYLFVPAQKIDMIQKAMASNADAVIIDLEDAVAKSEKEQARAVVQEALLNKQTDKPIYVRINDVNTSFWQDDLKCAMAGGAKGVVVPKAETKSGIKQVCDQAAESFEVIPLIETAKGIQFVYDIASCDPKIARLAFGSIDFSLDIDCELTETGQELLYARSQIVIASRAAELEAPIDAVYPNLRHSEGLKAEAKMARKLGFKAKLVIHPNQIESVNQIFSPSQHQIENAKQIVAAFEEAESKGSASIKVNDQFVDYPVYQKAKELLKGVL